MSMESSLIAWVNTFAGSDFPEIETLEQLSDGGAAEKILLHIFPEYEVARKDATSLDRIKNISAQIESHCDCKPEEHVSFDALVAGDVENISKFVIVMLFAAVHSDRKANFIRSITLLPSQVQLELMTAIESVSPVAKGASPQCTPSKNDGSLERIATTPNATPRTKQRIAFERDFENFAQLQRELALTRNELDESIILHDEVIKELNEKNKLLDTLQFKLQGLLSVEEKLRHVQDELYAKQEIEAKYIVLEKEFRKLEEKHILAQNEQFETKDKEQTSFESKMSMMSQELEVLNGRIKEYRVQLGRAEMSLKQEQLSSERKDAEIARLHQEKDDLNKEIDSLKPQLAILKVELQCARSSKSESPQRSPSVTHLEMQIQNLKGEVEDHKNEKAMLQKKLAEQTVFQHRVQDLEVLNEQLQKELAEKDKQLQLALSVSAPERSTFSEPRQKLVELRESLKDISHKIMGAGLKHVSPFNSPGPNAENAGNQSALPVTPVSQNISAQRYDDAGQLLPSVTLMTKKSPFVDGQQHGGKKGEPSYRDKTKTCESDVSNENSCDDFRVKEFSRRNNQYKPHLRSSYALETQCRPLSPMNANVPPQETVVKVKPAEMFEFSPPSNNGPPQGNVRRGMNPS